MNGKCLRTLFECRGVCFVCREPSWGIGSVYYPSNAVHPYLMSTFHTSCFQKKYPFSRRLIPERFTQPLTEMSTRNIKIIMFLGSKVRRVRKADNLTVICEPMSIQCGILNISQSYRPPRPVTRIDLLYRDGVCFPWGTNWTVSTATSSRLPRQCGILNISQPYRPPRPVTGKALLYIYLIPELFCIHISWTSSLIFLSLLCNNFL
jgi:hypothetical protein